MNALADIRFERDYIYAFFATRRALRFITFSAEKTGEISEIDASRASQRSPTRAIFDAMTTTPCRLPREQGHFGFGHYGLGLKSAMGLALA